MVPLEEQMGREKGTDKIEGGAFSGVNIDHIGGNHFLVDIGYYNY